MATATTATKYLRVAFGKVIVNALWDGYGYLVYRITDQSAVRAMVADGDLERVLVANTFGGDSRLYVAAGRGCRLTD